MQQSDAFPVNKRLGDAKDQALASLEESDDLISKEKAATIVKLISEAEKLSYESEALAAERLRHIADVDRLQRDSRLENTRLWAPLIVPTISAAVLAGTLIFQISQFKTTAEIQKAAAVDARTFQEKSAEDANWRDVVRTLSEAKTPESTLTGVTELKQFLLSKRYGEPAKELALHYLYQTLEPNAFEPLLKAIIGVPTWARFSELVTINRNLAAQRDFALSKLQSTPSVPAANKKLAIAYIEGYRSYWEPRQVNLSADLAAVSSQIATVISAKRPESIPLDLSNTIIIGDFHALNLSKANLYNCLLQSSSLVGTNLADVSSFAQSQWSTSPWWQAEHISPSLLEYLLAAYPYDPTYAQNFGTTEEDFDRNIARLRKVGSSDPR